ncbi:hypothetical protein C1M51_17865 [Methylibium sp. Pch-M]|uniref:hypothetical protein n=1 Tax=Methylibium sp. Pch-M TaxID=2082386 RepID=UPI0010101615|nr:hypothetical protein [Methylibium sp. Pch-M]QAZ41133.1 hypothetical protein C1M51_17865 [Methylibium sp. Pch-M]
MLDSFKRWIDGKRGGPDGRLLQTWAKQRGSVFKRVRNGEGVVIEGEMHGTPWRMEWGTPQRAYLLDRELRLRMDLGLPPSLQMMVISRVLAEELEQAAYALFTQDMQTQIDSGMPEEMRWLAMFPKTQLAALKMLRNRYTTASNAAAPLAVWLDKDLVGQLEAARQGWLGEEGPLVLMTLRGRLYLRVESVQPDAALLDGVMALFEAAARGALAAAEGASSQTQWPSTSTTAWQSHLPSHYPADAGLGDNRR